MKCVVGKPVSDEFPVDPRTAGLGVVQGFKHEQAGPLAHDKAVPLAVEGAAGLGRRVVAPGERPGRTKARQGRCATSCSPEA